MTPKLYLLMPHDRVDVSRAQSFGEIVTIFPRYEDRPDFWSSELITEAIDFMQRDGYRPDCDYLLIAGHMVPLIRLACSLVQIEPDARGLFWDAIERRYIPHVLSEYRETEDAPDSNRPVQTGTRAPRGVRQEGRRAS